jgi:AraC-like DNA-binding protein
MTARLDRDSDPSRIMSHDTLSDVLRSVRLRGAVFFHVSGSDEWAAEAPASREIAPLLMPGVDHVMEYHLVARGECWAAIPGGPAERLSTGDVVIFPHGDAHVVSSARGMRGDPPDLRWYGDSAMARLPIGVAFNGSKAPSTAPSEVEGETTIVCGFLGCDLQPFNPFIASLPHLLHLRAPADGGWIAQFIQHAVSESRARQPGSDAMLARMSEMMFVDAVRRYTASLPANSRGWLAGMRDHLVGRALALLHEQPARDWTIDELGRRIGLSRSALHERFVQLIGVPPMQYLAQWRMQAAASLLLDTRATIATIALEVGYDSEAAFARAFKRLVGRPPAAWRREHDPTLA